MGSQESRRSDEKLIEKAAKAMADAGDVGWSGHTESERDWYRRDARVALAVFREHTAVEGSANLPQNSEHTAPATDEAEALDGMSEYAPTTDEVREAYILAADTTNADRDNGEDFDHWLNRVRAEARAGGIRGAAEAVHAEARWQQEQVMRGAVQKSGAESAVERLLVVEELLKQQADYWEQNREGREGSET